MKLKPIDFTNEKKEFDAYEKVSEVSFRKCNHKKAKLVGREIRCDCGVGYTGPRIEELYRKLTS